MPDKILPLTALKAALRPLRDNGARIVFTNGCFDILHAGHVAYLQAARSEGDVLVVGLNSDRSVRCIKGHLRPIVSQHQRAVVLAALACVGYVVLFDSPDPAQLIEAIRPAILVKGADWAADRIVGADTVRAAGGRVVRIPLVAGASTTAIIDRIVRRYGPGSGG